MRNRSLVKRKGREGGRDKEEDEGGVGANKKKREKGGKGGGEGRVTAKKGGSCGHVHVHRK